MGNDVGMSRPGGNGQVPRPPTMLQAVNGLMVSLGALYLATESLAVVLVGATVAVVVVVVYMIKRCL
jgi:hypothetical protein